MPWISPNRSARSPRAPSAFITPCLPTVAPKPPIGPGWVHEIKHDGYRLQVHVRDGRVRLFTRTGVDWSALLLDLLGCGAAPGQARHHGCRVLLYRRRWVTDFNALHSRVNDHNAFAYA